MSLNTKMLKKTPGTNAVRPAGDLAAEKKSGRRQPRTIHFYGIAELAEKLSEKQKFFWTTDGSMYAIEVRSEKPTCFRRLDKDRTLGGRQRVKTRKRNQKFYRAMEEQKNEIGQGFADTAAGRTEESQAQG